MRERKREHLSFRDDLNSHLLPLELPFLELGRTSIPKMPSPHLIPHLILALQILRKPKSLIQTSEPPLGLAPLRYRRLVWLHRPLSPGQHRPYVLRRRRRREGALEEPPGGGVGARIESGRLLREEMVGWAGAVEGEERRSLSDLLWVLLRLLLPLDFAIRMS